MTPAIQFLKKHNIVHTLHTYQIESPTGQYGQDVADQLGVAHTHLFKTLMISLNGDPKKLAVCIIPVSSTLNLKQAAKAHGVKKAAMADPTIAEKMTGYVVGGISPFGQKRQFPTCIDDSAESLDEVFFSAGKRGLQVSLKASDLLSALSANTFALTN